MQRMTLFSNKKHAFIFGKLLCFEITLDMLLCGWKKLLSQMNKTLLKTVSSVSKMYCVRLFVLFHKKLTYGRYDGGYMILITLYYVGIFMVL